MGSQDKRSSAGLKELVPHGYIGIDFGTSNSHFAYCNTDGVLVAEPISLDGNEKSVHTCVLWKEPAQEDSDVVTFGSEAVQEWSNREPAERKGFRFAAGFKPDIVVSDRARLDARGFLRKAYLTIREKGVLRAIGRDEGMPVVVGVPAEIGPEHRRITAQIAEGAGFGPVTCIEEPLVRWPTTWPTTTSRPPRPAGESSWSTSAAAPWTSRCWTSTDSATPGAIPPWAAGCSMTSSSSGCSTRTQARRSTRATSCSSGSSPAVR